MAAIKALEKEAQQRQQSQLFIETPYRNGALFADLLAHLQPGTRLCVAADVTGAGEFIKTLTVARLAAAAGPGAAQDSDGVCDGDVASTRHESRSCSERNVEAWRDS